jgi:TonB family protein
MRKIVLPAALTLLLLSAVSAQVKSAAKPQEATWQTYTFTGEEFSVALPEMPVLDHSSRRINGFVNRIESAREYAAYGDGVVYLIHSYDRPRKGEDLAFFARDYVRSLLDAGQSIEIRMERVFVLGKFSGRQYVIVRDSQPSSNPGSSIYVFMAGRHAYAVRAVGGDDKHPDVQRFIDSFTLADRPAGRQIVDESRLAPPPVALADPAVTWQFGNSGSPGADPNLKGAAPQTGGDGGAGTEAGESRAGSDDARAVNAPVDGVVDAERIYKWREVTRKASVVYKPEPAYTEKARKSQLTGTVRMRVVLSADGKVTNILALTTLPHGLTEQAGRAARHIKFIPAVLDGRRVSQYAFIEYNFNIY